MIGNYFKILKSQSESSRKTAKIISDALSEHIKSRCQVEYVCGEGWCYSFRIYGESSTRICPVSELSVEQFLKLTPTETKSKLIKGSL